MNHDTPLSPRPLHHLTDASRRVMTSRQLREHGVPAHRTGERCRPGGPWQQLLPGVHLLHPGPPTTEDRLQAVLLYATQRLSPVTGAAPAPAERPAMITGLAALALHGFGAVPPPHALEHIEVLVPATRRLRSVGFARVVRDSALPDPAHLGDVPVAPVPRALADAVAELTAEQQPFEALAPAAPALPVPRRAVAPGSARPAAAATGPAVVVPSAYAHAVTLVCRLLGEAVRGGHCEPGAVVAELTRAGLLDRPAVVEAVETLMAEGRTQAESRLYTLVREHGLPEPVWNVDLRLPGGPHLGAVDAYWPEHAVAVEIDVRGPRRDESEAEVVWSDQVRRRETLERLGITVVHLTPRKLRESAEQQAAVVRTALAASAEREPSAYVVVLPR